MRIIIILLISGYLYPQRNDSQAAFYNIGSKAIIGGVGALINKKSDEKGSKVFLKGMYQGALGGYLTFESKRLVRQFHRTDNYAYLWPSKILNSAGNSIIYNAASNRNFWERWHMDFGFNYLEYDFKREKKLRYRILPFALYGNAYGFATSKFHFKRTLYSGHFIFKSINPQEFNELETYGSALFNTIQFKRNINIDIEAVIAHEIIHVYQYTSAFFINAYLKEPIKRLEENSNFFKQYNKVFYTDLNAPLNGGLYNIQTLFRVNYYDLLQEKEADYYSSNHF
ncbi:hypothetical protein [Maribacter sp. IgM3_T14_3]|uniref:hypothetical protein n=1 Tax=Maribacter sp. IgM3_T14_3 TaxID=3415140 RepID=UPI003C6F89E9